MYQFIVSRGVPLPFVLQTRYPSCAIVLEASTEDDIKQYHECLLFVKVDEKSNVTCDFSVFDQLSDEVHNIDLSSITASDICT